MKKKLLIGLLILSLIAALLVGCASSSKKPARDEEDEKTADSEDTDAPKTETPETEATELSEAPTEPSEEQPEADTVFVITDDQSCNHFTNGVIDILFRHDGSVVRADTVAEQMQTLFTVTPDDEINIALIGVTDHRLYFGWNEVEDWWGVNVYSVDYHGEDRQELGGAWDPSFENGWLILLGFRSDVSPTELLLIDRYDEIVAEDQTGAVWDAVLLDESVYYVMVEDLGEEPWARDDMDGKWKFDLIRADADGTTTVLKVFENRPNYYTPAFFMGNVLCFYETSEFYEIPSLKPTEDPNGLTGI
ncbi:MAG: hypothetical protein IJJ99_00610 [Oscillospiraceae bacterium]|nr:hypothetical protein [Oscillospiraceae bacterium]